MCGCPAHERVDEVCVVMCLPRALTCTHTPATHPAPPYYFHRSTFKRLRAQRLQQQREQPGGGPAVVIHKGQEHTQTRAHQGHRQHNEQQLQQQLQREKERRGSSGSANEARPPLPPSSSYVPVDVVRAYSSDQQPHAGTHTHTHGEGGPAAPVPCG